MWAWIIEFTYVHPVVLSGCLRMELRRMAVLLMRLPQVKYVGILLILGLPYSLIAFVVSSLALPCHFVFLLTVRFVLSHCIA